MSNICRPILLKERHLKKLFKVVMDNETMHFVANALNLDADRLKVYHKRGKELYEVYQELLEDKGFLDIDIFPYEDEFENLTETIKIEFLDLYKYESITEKNRYIWEEFVGLAKAEYIEENRYRIEWDIISNIKFVDNEILNSNIRLLIMFYKIFERALATLGSIEYLSAIKKHAKTSKNIKLAENRLKKLYKEDFIEEVVENKKVDNLKISMFDELLKHVAEQQDKQKKLLTNNEEIIDIKHIEKKDS